MSRSIASRCTVAPYRITPRCPSVRVNLSLREPVIPGKEAVAVYIKSSIIRFKPIVWLDDSRKRVRDFPDAARQRAGFELWEVQQGNDPSDWKPMPSAGPGVREIRVHADGEFRVLYIARFDEAIYVLHAFAKKSRRTPKPDIDLANARYRALVNERRVKR